MTNEHAPRRELARAAQLETTRRHFFGQCGVSLGSMAALTIAGSADPRQAVADAVRRIGPHFAPTAKRVIYLFMAGGPSQLELFDYKPALTKYDGKPLPESFTKGKRFAFIKPDANVVGARPKFAQHGPSGMWISEHLPHLASIADDVSFIRTLKTEVFNHGPAKCFVNTGSPRFGRPAMGAWASYGLGNEAEDLPAFIVLQSGPRGPRGGTQLYASGFLPTTHQGVPLRNTGDPILNLGSPAGFDRHRQQATISAIKALNAERQYETGDPEIATRIAAYEMAFRMQTSAPELIDLSQESKATLDLYGADPAKPSFARNCLLARRLVERGVRFVQLYHTDWDHHGGKNFDLTDALPKVAREIDQPAAALVKDLKSRGLLDETLVVWGGEFGRTPMGENREGILGRDHHIEAFTVWMAGGGIRPGRVVGETDDFGWTAAERPVHVHDLQATILHCLGLDHERLTFRFRGRDFRLTDVAGHVIPELVA